MTNWNASIFATVVRATAARGAPRVHPGRLTPLRSVPNTPSTQGGGEARLVTLSLVAGNDYPKVAPTIKFTSKITMDCVDAKGNVSGGTRRG